MEDEINIKMNKRMANDLLLSVKQTITDISPFVDDQHLFEWSNPAASPLDDLKTVRQRMPITLGINHLCITCALKNECSDFECLACGYSKYIKDLK